MDDQNDKPKFPAWFLAAIAVGVLVFAGAYAMNAYDDHKTSSRIEKGYTPSCNEGSTFNQPENCETR